VQGCKSSRPDCLEKEVVIPEWLYRESILNLAPEKSQWIPDGACPSMIKAGEGMTTK
jgi:hypothetical protein